MACVGFYAIIQSGVWDGPLFQFFERFFTRHPVEYCEAGMFFVGMAALLIKAISITRQYRGLSEPLLDPIPRGGQTVLDCDAVSRQLEQVPAAQNDDYRVRRLRDAVQHVRRSESAEDLDDQLKYLADLDVGRLYNSYGLVRMIVWAIPILGFLGTVIGIAQALGNLAPQALENSLPLVMSSLTVAFDTTTLALGLCIVLFFAQFLVDREENRLLDLVDRRVEEEMIGRFERIPNGPDGQLVAVRRMIETLIESTEQLVRRQTELWQTSFDAARQRWTGIAEDARKTLQEALAGALEENLQTHAREIVASEQRAGETTRQQWEPIQKALIQNSETLTEMHWAVMHKAEVLGRAVEAAGQVAKLEETLNRNLSALAGAKNFEQTVMSLAATIHLLNARIGDQPDETLNVELEPESTRQTGQAA